MSVLPIAVAWIPIAIIILLLIYIASLLKKLVDAGSHSGGTSMTPAGSAAVNGALQLIATIRARENPRPTADECKRLKAMLQTMLDEDVSQLSVTPIKTSIELLCPDE
jgi:hypothetical protein